MISSAAGPAAFTDAAALEAWRRRVAFAARVSGAADTAGDAGEPMWPPTDADIERVLRALCEDRTSFAELRAADLGAAVRAALPPERRALVDRLAPEHVQIPGRRRVRVHYEDDRPPWIASRLQDFFGAAAGPGVGGGRVPLVLHLLAPNDRAVQVTSDLAGFWDRHYPALRRELSRRYPRHDWPEDPLSARPPARGPPRRRS